MVLSELVFCWMWWKELEVMLNGMHYSCHTKVVVLAFDEMRIKEQIAYSSATGDIVGYVDFGDKTLSSLSKRKEMVTCHMLAVFMRVDGLAANRSVMKLLAEKVTNYFPKLFSEMKF